MRVPRRVKTCTWYAEQVRFLLQKSIYLFDELLFKIVFYFLISWISSINIRYSQLHYRRRHSFLKNGCIKSTPTHLCALVGVSFARIIPELSANHIFMASFVSWLVAQVAKLFTNCYRKGKWELKVMFDSGGMPSSHTSLVFSLTTAIALQYGLGSPLFPLSLAFSLIVAYDAAGVRRHAGKQAEVLNRILADVFHGSPISDTKLKEVLGHSPLQVTCGAVLGILVGSFYMLSFA